MHATRAYESSGILPPYNQKFSNETKDFVNDLMKETRLTNSQRKEFGYILRSGDPVRLDSHEMMKRRFLMKRRNISRSLGYIQSNDNLQSRQQQLQQRFMRMSLCSVKSGKRRLDQIKASGAYEPPVPQPPSGSKRVINSKEKEIQRLQYIMEFGNEKPTPGQLLQNKEKQLADLTAKKNPPELEKVERFNEILDEIADRVQFMNEMQDMGKDKDYRGIIEFQLKEKIQELQDKYCRNDVQEVIHQFGLEHFLPKTEWNPKN